MAIAGVAAATRLGRLVPDDLSVVGYDDVPVAAYMHPSLTTVAQDALTWGRAATRAVFDLVERPRRRRCGVGSRSTRRSRVHCSGSTDWPARWASIITIHPIPINQEDMMKRSTIAALAAVGLAGGALGAGASVTAAPAGALESRGPITIWLSNNTFELEWGTAMVEAWNAENPDEEVTAQEIPAGRTSEEVIGAAITAGNAPCLIFNTAPAAVPQFQRQGGLVSLDSFPDGADYVAERTGDRAEQYRSSDGGLYQMPWKANPVMIIYNRAIFEAAGTRPRQPPARHLRRVPGDVSDPRRRGRRGGGDLAVAGGRVLPAVVRLLPDVHRPERTGPGRGRGSHVRVRRRLRGRRVLAQPLRRRIDST